MNKVNAHVQNVRYKIDWFELSMALGATLATLIGISFS